MIQHWIQTRGKDVTIDVIVEALESCVMGNHSLGCKIRDDPEIHSTYYHGISVIDLKTFDILVHN